MYEDGLHKRASSYASNRREGYLAQMKLGKVKKKNQDELNWIWVAHYEGFKEALTQTKKPVAWQFMDGSTFRKRRPDDFDELDSDGLPYWRPLYTTPSQRTWAGLTKEDMPNDENPMFDHEYFIAGIVYANNILLEKNA